MSCIRNYKGSISSWKALKKALREKEQSVGNYKPISKEKNESKTSDNASS